VKTIDLPLRQAALGAAHLLPLKLRKPPPGDRMLDTWSKEQFVPGRFASAAWGRRPWPAGAHPGLWPCPTLLLPVWRTIATGATKWTAADVCPRVAAVSHFPPGHTVAWPPEPGEPIRLTGWSVRRWT